MSHPPLMVLTDEELEVLAPGPSPVVQPYAAQLEPRDLALARRTATRSLTARGVLARSDRAAPPGVQGPVAPLLDLRAGAPVVGVLHRSLGAPVDQPGEPSSLSRCLHVVGDVVLVEDVAPEGVHVFGMVHAERLREVVGEFLLPDGILAPAPDTHPPRELSAGAADDWWTATLYQLGGPRLLAEATVLRSVPGEPPVLTVAVGPGGCFVGSSEQNPEGAPTFTEVGADGVLDAVLTELEAARVAVQHAVAEQGLDVPPAGPPPRAGAAG